MIRARTAFLIALVSLAPIQVSAKPKKVAPEADTKPPVIAHVHVTRAPAGEPIVIRARFEDESEIFAPSLYARSEGQGEFESFGMKHIGDGWEATIPGSMAKKNVEYFIEAFDDQGNGPSREGSPEGPIKITVFVPAQDEAVKEEPKRPLDLAVVPKDEAQAGGLSAETGAAKAAEDDGSIATKWWFWTIVGLAITAGVATGVVLLQPGQKVDRVDVMVVGPNPAKGL